MYFAKNDSKNYAKNTSHEVYPKLSIANLATKANVNIWAKNTYFYVGLLAKIFTPIFMNFLFHVNFGGF